MQAGYLLRQYRTNELVRWRMHFSSDAIAELEGLTYGKSKNLQAAGAGKGIRQRCRRIVRYCPNALFAASTRHTHGVKACYLIMRPDPCTRLSRVKRHAPRTSAARLYTAFHHIPGQPLVAAGQAEVDAVRHACG